MLVIMNRITGIDYNGQVNKVCIYCAASTALSVVIVEFD